MGHYAAEMHLDIKAAKLPPEETKWLVDRDDWQVITTKEYDRKYSTVNTPRGKIKGNPRIRRFGYALFSTIQEAQADRERLLLEELAEAKSLVARLEELLTKSI